MESIQRQILLFRAFAKHSQAIVAAKDLDGRYFYVNTEYCRLLGKPEQACLGFTDMDLLPTHAARQSQATDHHVMQHQETVHIEESLTLDGVLRHYLTVRFPIHDGQGDICAIGHIATDITETKRLEAELRTRAERDPLTGCYNRAKLYEIADFEVNRATRYRYPLTVLMLDIDHFKGINDTYGHATGDLVIKGIADLCTATLRDNDTLARLGGDEFVILLPHTAIREGMELARRLRHAIYASRFHSDDGQPIPVTTSIGVVQKDDTSNSFESLLSSADEAMYQAKDDGRNCIRPHLRRWKTPGLRSLFSIAPR